MFLVVIQLKGNPLSVKVVMLIHLWKLQILFHYLSTKSLDPKREPREVLYCFSIYAMID
jgi:hypothetical protein